MVQIRICPQCNIEIPVDTGFAFDEDLNMICKNCSGIIYPVSEEAEKMFKSKILSQNIFSMTEKFENAQKK